MDNLWMYCKRAYKEVDKVINRPSKVYDINNIDELDRVIFE